MERTQGKKIVRVRQIAFAGTFEGTYDAEIREVGDFLGVRLVVFIYCITLLASKQASKIILSKVYICTYMHIFESILLSVR